MKASDTAVIQRMIDATRASNLARDAQFSESDHPRDNDGKFRAAAHSAAAKAHAAASASKGTPQHEEHKKKANELTQKAHGASMSYGGENERRASKHANGANGYGFNSQAEKFHKEAA